jgi:hypothetical protein
MKPKPIADKHRFANHSQEKPVSLPPDPPGPEFV